MGGTRRLTALSIIIILFGPLGVASGAISSATPFAIALTILPPKLPADGNVYPAILVSLIDTAGQPTIALNDTSILLTSSFDSVGSAQSTAVIAIGRASPTANLTTPDAYGPTPIT